MSESDAALVRRVRAGDKEAFARLLDRHQSLLRRVCRRLLGTADGLEDVVQEAALQALLGLNALRDPHQFGPWLAGIGLNIARRSLHSRARDVWSWDALLGGRLANEPVEESPGPLEFAEAEELSRSVRAAVADLPHGQRAAVLLVYLSGLSYRETAATLGVEVGAVKTRLHKGRERLRERLRDLWKEDFMTMSVEQQMVEMRIAAIRQHNEEDARPHRVFVLLEEVGGTRQVPIWVGRWEGDSLAMLLEKVKVPRPLTHAFTASLLRAGGVQVRQVRVARLVEDRFYAEVVLIGAHGERVVDARPSDALALAIETSAPIYAAEEVIVACEATRATREALSSTGIGAAEMVTNIIAHWPSEPKPVR